MNIMILSMILSYMYNKLIYKFSSFQYNFQIPYHGCSPIGNKSY